ncbi:hypothetical protein V1282_004919 [Nitrobacteraceae bacterium AZCC 2146]
MTEVERREVPRPTSLGARGWRYQLRGRTDRKVCPKASRKRLGASRRSTGPARRGASGKPRTPSRRGNGFACVV